MGAVEYTVELMGVAVKEIFGPDHWPGCFNALAIQAFLKFFFMLVLSLLRMKYFRSVGEIQQWKEGLSLRQVSLLSQHQTRCETQRL